MSVIHSSWVLLGRRSLLMAGTARCSTVKSIEYSTAASASTASPIHSRRPARRTPLAACSSGVFMCIPPSAGAPGDDLVRHCARGGRQRLRCQPVGPDRSGVWPLMPDYGVPQVRCLGPLDHVQDLQLDVLAADAFEQAGAVTQQNGNEVDADLVDAARLAAAVAGTGRVE